jgi:hypothetical protein
MGPQIGRATARSLKPLCRRVFHDHPLILKRAALSRSDGTWKDDDYELTSNRSCADGVRGA